MRSTPRTTSPRPLPRRSLNRIVRATLVALLAGVLATLGAFAPALAAAPVPKVVLVVGPVGSLTARYRALADAAAAEATAAGAEVVKVYSPDATWPAVRAAARGASILVYLGHGNGFPSRYRDALYPPTQDGFGLNPVAGVDDTAHQYFGEAAVEDLALAPDAVVLLHHLCYASGNTEPGLSEGTREDAIARVDNFAAGFIRAGAGAVVAEAHLGPAYYVRALLRSRAAVDRIWAGSPSAKGHAFAVASRRSAGYTEQLDPDRRGGGYYRSLVSRSLTAAAVRAGATGSVGAAALRPPAEPSLAGRGLRFGTLALRSLPIATTTTRLTLPLAGGAAGAVPAGAEVGVRWDPLLLDPAPVPDPSPAASPDPSATPDPAATPTPPPEPPEVDLVAPEQLGTVVTVGAAARGARGLAVKVTYPAAPGLYRLVATLHAPSGVAYDAATQALLTPVLVRVGGPVAVAYGAPGSLALGAGAGASLAVRVVNAGSEAWDQAADAPPAGGGEAILSWLRTARLPADLVATWVSPAGLPVPDPVPVVLDPAVAAPGGAVSVTVPLVAPAVAGDYLLLLDVASPAHGSLTALGNAPGLVRVSVTGTAPAPAASGTPGPGASGAAP